MFASAELYNVVEKLSEERKNAIYKLALDMLAAQQSEEFDDYALEDIEIIHDAKKNIADGNCLSFISADEMIAHFEQFN